MEEQSMIAPAKVFAHPADRHVHLGGSLRAVLLWGPAVLLLGTLLALTSVRFISIAAAIGTGLALFLGLAILLSGLRVAAQWERGVILRLGRFRAIRGPGVLYVIPVLEYVRFVDTRTLVVNIPLQKVITQDNVPAEIDGALFVTITDPDKAIITVQDFLFAVAQYAQAALRDVVGGLTLDELLAERERIEQRISQSIEARVRDWGLHVESLRLQDIELPEDLKRVMSRQAAAEREKRATITKSEGDRLAAENLAAAAKTMMSSLGAMQLRTLQTIEALAGSASNTVLMVPADVLDMLKIKDKPAET